MRVFFTSDTHFNHPKVAETRGFASAAEHDEALIDRWNSAVGREDHVWHLGDVGMGSVGIVLPLINRLNGVKHLVTGNHDQPWPGNRDGYKHVRNWMYYFFSVQQFARRKVAGRNVMLSHFPYDGDHTPGDRHGEYRLPDFGFPILHGHTHSGEAITRSAASRALQVHVGVDAWDLAPAPLETISKFVEERA